MARMPNDSGSSSLYTEESSYALRRSWLETWRSCDLGVLVVREVLSWVGRSCESIQLSHSSHDESVLWLRCCLRWVSYRRRIDEGCVVLQENPVMWPIFVEASLAA